MNNSKWVSNFNEWEHQDTLTHGRKGWTCSAEGGTCLTRFSDEYGKSGALLLHLFLLLLQVSFLLISSSSPDSKWPSLRILIPFLLQIHCFDASNCLFSFSSSRHRPLLPHHPPLPFLLFSFSFFISRHLPSKLLFPLLILLQFFPSRRVISRCFLVCMINEWRNRQTGMEADKGTWRRLIHVQPLTMRVCFLPFLILLVY